MATKSVTKGTTARGKVLSFIRCNGEWLAIVASFTSGPTEPVLSSIMPVAELTGSAKRKAERWLEFLA